MSDPTSPPPDAPSPAPEAAPSLPAAAKTAPRKCNWHRVRVYTWGILLVFTMWFCGIMVEIRYHPISMINRALAELPYPSSAGSAQWLNRRTLEVDNVKIGNFFNADSLIITASPFYLWRHHLAKVQVTGAQLYAKELTTSLEKSAPNGTSGWNAKNIFNKIVAFFAGYSDDGLDWVIGRLEINRGTLMLNNLIENTAIPIRLGVRHPIVLTTLRLGKPDSSPGMSEERTVQIGAVSISSPFDPLTPVFYFPLTQVTYTYTEIWHHHIRRVEMMHPTMFLGEDLFWLTKQLRSGKPKPATGVEAPWLLGEFKVDYGRLAVNAFGQPVVHFPFFIETKVDDIRLDQLDKISVKSSVNIANLTQDYPEYKVNIRNLHGKLYFNWPPSDAKANNVTNDIYIDAISWNGIPAKQVYSSVTFDPNGVYGKLYGMCEGGQLSGNFEFYYAKGFTWNADFFAQKVNCQPVAEKMAGKYCNLTGELDGRIEVQGKATEILNCQGLLQLPIPGVLKIKSMEDLLQRLPPDTIALKRQALKLVIDSFDTYPYDYGKLTLQYTPAGGTSELRLDGPRGSRDFSVVLHPFNLAAAAEAVGLKPAPTPANDQTTSSSAGGAAGPSGG
jgi:hypothetical protein